ncbi:MAG: ferritin family protein, partial [Planctomycetota bacterium]
MEKFGSVDEALDFAIKREEESFRLYTDLAAKMDRQAMKDVFTQFAREEKGHRSKLEAIKSGKQLVPAQKVVADLKIGDYLVDVETTEDMDYQSALILAMKKEKAA